MIPDKLPTDYRIDNLFDFVARKNQFEDLRKYKKIQMDQS